jgi:putative transposase
LLSDSITIFGQPGGLQTKYIECDRTRNTLSSAIADLVGWVEQSETQQQIDKAIMDLWNTVAQIFRKHLFFTLVTHNRRPLLCQPENINLLRDSFKKVMTKHPFIIDAIAILPDHLHCLWTLPPQDADFSTRWRLIKSWFSRRCALQYQGDVSASRQSKQEKAIWQRRFWEHLIRNEQDFINHVDYVHYNPVHHGLASFPKDWQYSSFHRYVQRGVYDVDWGGKKLVFDSLVGGE